MPYIGRLIPGQSYFPDNKYFLKEKMVIYVCALMQEWLFYFGPAWIDNVFMAQYIVINNSKCFI